MALFLTSSLLWNGALAEASFLQEPLHSIQQDRGKTQNLFVQTALAPHAAAVHLGAGNHVWAHVAVLANDIFYQTHPSGARQFKVQASEDSLPRDVFLDPVTYQLVTEKIPVGTRIDYFGRQAFEMIGLADRSIIEKGSLAINGDIDLHLQTAVVDGEREAIERQIRLAYSGFEVSFTSDEDYDHLTAHGPFTVNSVVVSITRVSATDIAIDIGRGQDVPIRDALSRDIRFVGTIPNKIAVRPMIIQGLIYHERFGMRFALGVEDAIRRSLNSMETLSVEEQHAVKARLRKLFATSRDPKETHRWVIADLLSPQSDNRWLVEAVNETYSMAMTQRLRGNNSYPTADILGPFVHPERSSATWQTFYYIGIGMVEEFFFRYLPLHGLPQAIHQGLSLALMGHFLISLSVSIGLFFLIHSIVRWHARALKLGLSTQTSMYRKGLWHQIHMDWEQLNRDPMHSIMLPTLAFNVLYGFALTFVNPDVAWSIVSSVHMGWDTFINGPRQQDPLPPQEVGKHRQMRSMASLKEGDFSTYWLVFGDGDRFGKKNTALGKSTVGHLETPASPDVIFYKQSIFKIMRQVLVKVFREQGWRVYRGIGGDEFEAGVSGSSSDVKAGLDKIVAQYESAFKNRYQFFAIERSELSSLQIKNLKKLKASRVLQRHAGTFVLSMEGSFDPRDLQNALGPDVLIDPIKVENKSMGPFTITLGAISVEKVISVLADKASPTYWRNEWVDPTTHRILPERLEEVYIWGMRMADAMLSEGKNRGRNRARTSTAQFALGQFSVTRNDVLELRKLIEEGHGNDVYAKGTDPLTGELTYAQVRQEYNYKPRRFIYTFTISNWTGPHSVTSRALHELNEIAGHDKVDDAIRLLAKMIKKSFPEDGKNILIGRNPPDSFMVITDEEIQSLPEGFMKEFQASLKELGDDYDWRPHLLVYKTSLNDVRELKGITEGSLSAIGSANPLIFASDMASAEWVNDILRPVAESSTRESDGGLQQLDLDRLQEDFDVFDAGSENYHLMTFNPQKARSMLSSFLQTQRLKVLAARMELAAMYEENGQFQEPNGKPVVIPIEKRLMQRVHYFLFLVKNPAAIFNRSHPRLLERERIAA